MLRLPTAAFRPVHHLLPISHRPDRHLATRWKCIMQRSEAAERNKGPILSVLQRVLPARGRLLEVSSGTGQHVAFFASSMPDWHFSPTDLDTSSLTSIDKHVEKANVANVAPAVRLDASAWPWPVTEADAIFNCNMVHISPWKATEGLMAGAGKVLSKGGKLVLYGPYVIDGETAESNKRFSESLKGRDPSWGVRELGDVKEVAQKNGLSHVETVGMPANNHCVVFTKD